MTETAVGPPPRIDGSAATASRMRPLTATCAVKRRADTPRGAEPTRSGGQIRFRASAVINGSQHQIGCGKHLSCLGSEQQSVMLLFAL